MSLFIFLTVLQAIVAAALVGVILIQRSEGGGLGVGGSPAGLMSARGAANFLTRMTTFLAISFVSLSITLAVVAVGASSTAKIDTSLQRGTPVQAPLDPLSADPLAGVGAPPATTTAPPPAASASPAPADPQSSDPLRGAAQ